MSRANNGGGTEPNKRRVYGLSCLPSAAVAAVPAFQRSCRRARRRLALRCPSTHMSE